MLSCFRQSAGECIDSHCHITRVVKFRRTGESSRSDEDATSEEHEVQIEGVQTALEAVELEDGETVPKEFANPTDGEMNVRGLFLYLSKLYPMCSHSYSR